MFWGCRGASSAHQYLLKFPAAVPPLLVHAAQQHPVTEEGALQKSTVRSVQGHGLSPTARDTHQSHRGERSGQCDDRGDQAELPCLALHNHIHTDPIGFGQHPCAGPVPAVVLGKPGRRAGTGVRAGGRHGDTEGMGLSPVVVAWRCQSPFGVEATEGVARVALSVRQIQVAVPADDDTNHSTLQQGSRACAAIAHSRHSTPRRPSSPGAQHPLGTVSPGHGLPRTRSSPEEPKGRDPQCWGMLG